jgi:hypothetical protein
MKADKYFQFYKLFYSKFYNIHWYIF